MPRHARFSVPSALPSSATVKRNATGRRFGGGAVLLPSILMDKHGAETIFCSLSLTCCTEGDETERPENRALLYRKTKHCSLRLIIGMGISGKIRFRGVHQHPPASVLVLFVLLLLLRAPSCTVLALPAGFEDEELVQMTSAVDIAFVENMLLAITDKGIVYTVDLEDDDPQKRDALDLTERICHNGERGYVVR